jgi:FtsP/CotA-like multicopper oxidase with cupredoxin domain
MQPEDSNPRHHTQNMQERFRELIDHLREDVNKVFEPQLEAMFETSAEVIGVSRRRSATTSRTMKIPGNTTRTLPTDRLCPDRRQLLVAGGAGALGLAMPMSISRAQEKPDHTIRITSFAHEFAPGRVIRTYAYDGAVPGPPLRLQAGRSVSIEVINATDRDDIVHWHGLFNTTEADGALEEGSPMIPAGGSLVYRFTPRPTGTRWYHSHATAGTDLSRSTYSGQFGFLIIEPAHDPGAYDQEVLLAVHHWDGMWVSMQDVSKGPPPDNGLEVMYRAASINGFMLGHGEPVHVKQGQRVLFRILNASATENTKLALPGHRPWSASTETQCRCRPRWTCLNSAPASERTSSPR